MHAGPTAMSALPKNTPRRVVPRWRTSATAATTGELTPIPTQEPVLDNQRAQEEVQRVAGDFRWNRTVGHAADLLSAAVVLNRPAIGVEAARFLLTAPREAGPVASELAQRIVATVEAGHNELLGSPQVSLRFDGTVIARSAIKPGNIRDDVHELRQRLRDDPRNALGWLDLSRLYAGLGQNNKALRAVHAALALAPDNRFALRSAARLLLHVGHEDEAHGVLKRSNATRHDPWLMAAEIAIATVASLPPRTVKLARSALNARRHAAYHLGEVASALATLEANAGSTKAARKLFRQALEDPTENAVAQAEWAARNLRLFDFDPGLLSKPRTFEANTWAAYVSERWTDALAHAHSWLADEPFSGRAAGMGSVVAGVALEEFDTALEFARQGIRTNPDDQTLQNNLVFMLAEAGRVEEAALEHKRLRSTGLEGTARVMWLANTGLLEYRAGRIDSGRALYEQAIALAREKNPELELVAATFWAGEELRAFPSGHHDATRIDVILSDARKKGTPDLRLALARVKRILARQRGKPSQ